MLSSKRFKTGLVLVGQEGRGPKFKRGDGGLLAPYSAKTITNALTLRVTQPGLPAWWRLAAPHLNWVSTFVKHLTWAMLLLSPSPILPSKDSSLKMDWVVPRHRLVTLTRGPMARKKKSRVQFVLPKRPVEMRLSAKVQNPLELAPAKVKAGLRQISLEEGFWLEAWPTPSTVIKTRLRAHVSGADFLLWR